MLKTSEKAKLMGKISVRYRFFPLFPLPTPEYFMNTNWMDPLHRSVGTELGFEGSGKVQEKNHQVSSLDSVLWCFFH